MSADQAARHRLAIAQQMQAQFQNVDVLLSPTLPVSAILVGQDGPGGWPDRGPVGWSHFTYVVNLAGNPAASVPVGLGAGRMPVGLQIVGRPCDEVTVLQLVAALASDDTQFAMAAIDRCN